MKSLDWGDGQMLTTTWVLLTKTLSSMLLMMLLDMVCCCLDGWPEDLFEWSRDGTILSRERGCPPPVSYWRTRVWTIDGSGHNKSGGSPPTVGIIADSGESLWLLDKIPPVSSCSSSSPNRFRIWWKRWSSSSFRWISLALDQACLFRWRKAFSLRIVLRLAWTLGVRCFSWPPILSKIERMIDVDDGGVCNGGVSLRLVMSSNPESNCSEPLELLRELSVPLGDLSPSTGSSPKQ